MIYYAIIFIVGLIKIAMIIIGSLNLEDCKASSAALFLIISGVVGCIACIIAVLYDSFLRSEDFKGLGQCFGTRNFYEFIDRSFDDIFGLLEGCQKRPLLLQKWPVVWLKATFSKKVMAD